MLNYWSDDIVMFVVHPVAFYDILLYIVHNPKGAYKKD